MSSMMSASQPWRRSNEADAPACFWMSSEASPSTQLRLNTRAPAFVPHWSPGSAAADITTTQKSLASEDLGQAATPSFVCTVNLDEFTDDDEDSDLSENEHDDCFYDAFEDESDIKTSRLPTTQKSLTPNESPRSNCPSMGEPDAEPTPLNRLTADDDSSIYEDTNSGDVFGKTDMLAWRTVCMLSVEAPVSDVCVATHLRTTGLQREPAQPVPSETSWAAQQRSRRLAAAAHSDAEVARTIKSILNKLTVEKFGQLSQQLFSCGISTVDHVNILITEVFEKATQQHNFIDMYADLCVELHDYFSTNFQDSDNILKFRRLLLEKCQISFTEKLKPPEGLEMLDADERSLAECKYKAVMLGNIRFVGALLARGMLASKIFVTILQELLGDLTAESLEAAAALLTVAGPTFDNSQWTHYPALCAIFAQIDELVKTPKACSPRARFLLKDVLELRERSWEDKRPKRVEQPTTLAQQAEKAVQESSPRNDWAGTRNERW